MSFGIQTAAYIASSVLFILALGGLSGQESAKRAVWYGIVGMAVAILATITGPGVPLSPMLIGALVVGAGIGLVLAQRVEMTGMPELVAALHSFVGMAAVLIGLNSDLGPKFSWAYSSALSPSQGLSSPTANWLAASAAKP